MKQTGINGSTVTQALKSLEQGNYVEKELRRDGAVTHAITPRGAFELREARESKISAKSDARLEAAPSVVSLTDLALS